MAEKNALVLVQEDRHLDFNRLIEAAQGVVDLTEGQFRGYDLRRFNLQKADLTNAYLRNADLRGLDLTEANLQGVSIKDAKISGVMFPMSLSPAEIRLSLEYGTRMRNFPVNEQNSP